MVTPGKKPNVKRINSKKIIEDLHVNNNYGYYHDDKYTRPIQRLFHRNGVNCSDYSDDEEFINRLKCAYIREHIMRKPTPVELEWIKEQEKVTDPEVLEELRPALEWLNKYVFIVNEDKELKIVSYESTGLAGLIVRNIIILLTQLMRLIVGIIWS